jgi:hypothetical protein
MRANFIPALRWDWPIVPGKIMQGRPEGGGSFGNGLLHSRPLPYGMSTLHLTNIESSIHEREHI